MYDFSKLTIWFFSKMFFLYKIRIEALEKIPDTGPAVIVSSHKSWLDIPILCLISRRYIHYIAKEELYKYNFIKWYLDSTGVIPIKSGKNDREAIAKIIETIKKGEIVAIYPEGTRFKGDGIGELNNGIAVMLLRNKIYPPIYPIVMTYQKGKFFGLPLEIRTTVGEKIDTQKFAKVETLMEEIRYIMECLYKISKK